MEASFNSHHPECRPGEVWLINATLSEYLSMPYPSKRLGVQAYAIDGTRIRNDEPGSPMFPVFVDPADLRAHRIINRRWAPRPLGVFV